MNKPRPLTDRDMETLHELEGACRMNAGYKTGGAAYDHWARPLDCGGSNGSHHGATLAKLTKRGYAQRKGHRGARRTNYYMITSLGRTMLSHWLRQQKAKREAER